MLERYQSSCEHLNNPKKSSEMASSYRFVLTIIILRYIAVMAQNQMMYVSTFLVNVKLET
jgi:hypothetical protein